MFDLIAQLASTGDSSVACTVFGGFAGGLATAVAGRLFGTLPEENDVLELENHELRETLDSFLRRPGSPSAAVDSPSSRGAVGASPKVAQAILSTAQTIDDTCSKIAKFVEEAPAARPKRRAPRKSKKTETPEPDVSAPVAPTE